MEKKNENNASNEKNDKNFLQSALRKAIQMRRANLKLHEEEVNESEDDNWD